MERNGVNIKGKITLKLPPIQCDYKQQCQCLAKGKYGSFRTSLTHVFNKGQYPNQKLNKITYTAGGEMSYKNFKLEGSASYNKRVSSNDNGSGYSGSYIYDMVIWGGTEYDVRDYKNYWVEGKRNEQQNWYDNSWYDNPWFKANEVVDAYDTDILNVYMNSSYEITLLG